MTQLRPRTRFSKINGCSATIDPTELGILKARRKPNAIAARALMRAGTGHKYWKQFPVETQQRIEQLAKEAYELLFRPIVESRIKTLDVAIAGQSYSGEAFKLNFDLVNMLNGVTPTMWQVSNSTKRRAQHGAVLPLAEDNDGSQTISYLENVLDAAYLLSGKQPKSLGLHPMVYFYGATAKFQPTAFLAVLKFFLELEKQSKIFAFTSVRKDFEEFLIRHRHFINQVGHRYGSRTRPVDALVILYNSVFEQLKAGVTDDSAIVAHLQARPELSDLKDTARVERPAKKNFSKAVQNAAFLTEAIDTALRCKECAARLHINSMSADHDIRAEDGGTGGQPNLRWTHFYCNTGYKEKKHSEAKKARATDG